MKFETPRFGSIDVDADKMIRFENGMPGFPDCTQFIVMDHDIATPLKWLQCVERSEVAFLVVEPEQVLRNYEFDVPSWVLRLVSWNEGDDTRDVGAFLILNVNDGELTANLRAPVVVNIRKRLAFQMILDDMEIPIQHPIRPEEKTSDSP